MKRSEITKHINIIQDCIKDIRSGWQVGMNIQVLKTVADELLEKYKEGENNE